MVPPLIQRTKADQTCSWLLLQHWQWDKGCVHSNLFVALESFMLILSKLLSNWIDSRSFDPPECVSFYYLIYFLKLSPWLDYPCLFLSAHAPGEWRRNWFMWSWYASTHNVIGLVGVHPTPLPGPPISVSKWTHCRVRQNQIATSCSFQNETSSPRSAFPQQK